MGKTPASSKTPANREPEVTAPSEPNEGAAPELNEEAPGCPEDEAGTPSCPEETAAAPTESLEAEVPGEETAPACEETPTIGDADLEAARAEVLELRTVVAALEADRLALEGKLREAQEHIDELEALPPITFEPPAAPPQADVFIDYVPEGGANPGAALASGVDYVPEQSKCEFCDFKGTADQVKNHARQAHR